jgi:hypothetical protein
MISYKIGDVELLPDERPIKAWETGTTTWGPFPSEGKLYLTSKRLIWVREGMNFFPGPKSLVINLDAVASCMGHDYMSNHLITIKLRNGKARSFRVHWGISGKELAADIRAAIEARFAG